MSESAPEADPTKMATYEILYWNKYPAQIKARDEEGQVSLELDPRFMERIDRVAMQRGLVGTEEYLEGWKWSEPEERPGAARQVAEAVKQELEAEFEGASESSEG